MGGNAKSRTDYEFLTVLPLDPGYPDGTGKAFSLHTKGWLPYTVRWRFTVTEPITEQGFAISAHANHRWGDATDA
ncbi:hypothetical protein J2X42_004070 [Arthrobacter sp. BE255]|nr:hypothetical protein [Arthrobacter sp. BE255]